MIADRRRALPVVDPFDRELAISCGAAIANLEIAAAQFGFRPSVTLSPDPVNADLLAGVHLAVTGAPDPNPSGLLQAILRRRTTRARYAGNEPSPALIDACTAHAEALGINLTFISDEAKRRDIAEHVEQGDHLQFDDPSFRLELASWVHSTRMGRRDGMPGASFGMPDILAPVARFVMRMFDIGNGDASGDVKKIMEETPTLAVFSCNDDAQEAWLQTGRALGRVLLELTANGFTASYLNQPIETASLRPKLKEKTGSVEFPQILIRVGKSPDLPAPTARRMVEDVTV